MPNFLAATSGQFQDVSRNRILQYFQVLAFRKLTLSPGLRWEFYPPFTPNSAGHFSNYDPVANQLVIAGVGETL